VGAVVGIALGGIVCVAVGGTVEVGGSWVAVAVGTMNVAVLVGNGIEVAVAVGNTTKVAVGMTGGGVFGT
jgi:hypothetical protein